MTNAPVPVPAPREAWLRGPIDGVPALLQPVAHALRQADEEVSTLMRDFPDARLHERPCGVASPAFHLQHLAGVLDRLTTYARGESLDDAQLAALAREGADDAMVTDRALANAFSAQVEASIAWLRTVDPAILTQARYVGRNRLPSTVLGLIFHAAEHAMRHVGQLLVTVRVIRESPAPRG